MTKVKYTKQKAKELGEKLLEFIKEVKPKSRQRSLDDLEMGHLQRRLENYFKGYKLDELDELYSDIVIAFELQKDKALKDPIQKKYFTLQCMLRPKNFKRIVDWNLAEIDEADESDSNETHNPWNYYKDKKVNFLEEDL